MSVPFQERDTIAPDALVVGLSLRERYFIWFYPLVHNPCVLLLPRSEYLSVGTDSVLSPPARVTLKRQAAAPAVIIQLSLH